MFLSDLLPVGTKEVPLLVKDGVEDQKEPLALGGRLLSVIGLLRFLGIVEYI